MPLARMFNNPDVTKEHYDATVEKLGVSQDNLPKGGLVHLAGEGPDGSWRVVEVWESEEDAHAWDAKVEAALQEQGVTRLPPETWQVHKLFKS